MADLDRAIGDLREREETSSDRIGYIDIISGTERASARVNQSIGLQRNQDMGHCQRWDAAIWMALAANFEEKRNEVFCAASALQYLNELTDERKRRALEYGRNAPSEVVTPFRRLFYQNYPI